jgi:hypothetical protein
MCRISQRSDNLRRPTELAYRRHRCIDLAKTLAGLLSKYLTHEEPQGPIAQDCKQHPPKPGSSPARGRSLHWNRNFREKGRSTLLTGAISRDAPHRLRLSDDSGMTHQSRIDAPLNRQPTPDGSDRNCHSWEIGTAICRSTESRRTARRLRESRKTCHAVMLSISPAARRQIVLTLCIRSKKWRRQR